MAQSRAELTRELEEHLRFDTLLGELSARFINLPADQVNGGIEDAQRRICECLGLNLSSLWQQNPLSTAGLALPHGWFR